MYKIVVVLPGQTLFDIAIQEYGSLDAMSLIIEDNPSIDDITSISMEGVDVSIRRPIPALQIVNKQVAQIFRESIFSPATLIPIK